LHLEVPGQFTGVEDGSSRLHQGGSFGHAKHPEIFILKHALQLRQHCGLSRARTACEQDFVDFLVAIPLLGLKSSLPVPVDRVKVTVSQIMTAEH